MKNYNSPRIEKGQVIASIIVLAFVALFWAFLAHGARETQKEYHFCTKRVWVEHGIGKPHWQAVGDLCPNR